MEVMRMDIVKDSIKRYSEGYHHYFLVHRYDARHRGIFTISYIRDIDTEATHNCGKHDMDLDSDCQKLVVCVCKKVTHIQLFDCMYSLKSEVDIPFRYEKVVHVDIDTESLEGLERFKKEINNMVY